MPNHCHLSYQRLPNTGKHEQVNYVEGLTKILKSSQSHRYIKLLTNHTLNSNQCFSRKVITKLAEMKRSANFSSVEMQFEHGTKAIRSSFPHSKTYSNVFLYTWKRLLDICYEKKWVFFGLLWHLH